MRIKNHAFSISVCKTLSSRLLFFIETMESIRLVCGIETPGWLIEQIPVHLDQQAVGRFETRQNVTRYTFTRYRQIMNAMPSNSIPRVPTRDEALTLPKRRWEAIFQKWRQFSATGCQRMPQDATGRHRPLEPPPPQQKPPPQVAKTSALAVKSPRVIEFKELGGRGGSL